MHPPFSDEQVVTEAIADDDDRSPSEGSREEPAR
jgi:hypothetical protein